MPAEHLICPICHVKVSYTNYYKHFFSKKHVEEHVKPALLKMNKQELNVLRKSTTKSSLPKILCNDDTRHVVPCFGCKTAKSFQPQYHLNTECKNAEEHITTLKALLGEADDSTMSEDAVSLQRKLTALEKKDRANERMLNSIQEDINARDDFIYRMFGKDFDTIVTEMRERDIDDPKTYYESLDVARCSSYPKSKKGLEEEEAGYLSENTTGTTSSYIQGDRTFQELQDVDLDSLTEEEREKWDQEMMAALAVQGMLRM